MSTPQQTVDRSRPRGLSPTEILQSLNKKSLEAIFGPEDSDILDLVKKSFWLLVKSQGKAVLFLLSLIPEFIMIASGIMAAPGVIGVLVTCTGAIDGIIDSFRSVFVFNQALCRLVLKIQRMLYKAINKSGILDKMSSEMCAKAEKLLEKLRAQMQILAAKDAEATSPGGTPLTTQALRVASFVIEEDMTCFQGSDQELFPQLFRIAAELSEFREMQQDYHSNRNLLITSWHLAREMDQQY